MARVTALEFTKGHGTENDFVLIPSLDGRLDLNASHVAAICDRRAGLGADGLIRVVPTQVSEDPAVRALADRAQWFMDYRNADGSVAEMCGNGTRVFALYLQRQGLETGREFEIATRAGLKQIRIEGEPGEDGLIATNLGPWRFADPQTAQDQGFDALVHVDNDDPLSALSLDLGNPHTVVALPGHYDLAAIDLTVAPSVRPEPPQGTNVELVRPLDANNIAMRVYERGVGETRSCGTGAAAAALATSFWSGADEPTGTWGVRVPGGNLRVRALPGQEVELAGPAVLVADGTYHLN